MGEKFRRVVLDFVDETGTAARQLALWAGRTDTAVRNWKLGTAVPEADALERMLLKVPQAWKKRFQDAWDEDESPPSVFKKLVAFAQAASDLEKSGVPPLYAPSGWSEVQKKAHAAASAAIGSAPHTADAIERVATALAAAQPGTWYEDMVTGLEVAAKKRPLQNRAACA